ncbi:MAG: hypothetical protein E7773_00725 [Sphingomonas sp.]|uniref:hypothetical protein n=1 Tax=Sphingomonas sp. TaxID=28214 RepID=UPI001202EE85|nr:hypothetical protein [Sphingomonas sp.]THD38311.1 MAG: hypothetical protein E7773_00725 [Sphingomonas sp.]
MKISALPAVTEPTGSEQAVVVDTDGSAKRVDVSSLVAAGARAAVADQVTAAAASAADAADAKVASESARDAAVAAKNTAADDAAAALTSANNAEASNTNANAQRLLAVGAAGSASNSAAAALVAQQNAEAAASAPGLTIVGGVGYTQRPAVIGVPVGSTIYEMSSGGQSALIPPVLQLTKIGAGTTDNIVEGVHFEDSSKPIVLQFGRNRGNGIVGDPGFGKQSQAGDRLFIMGVYGGLNSDGTGSAFSHAGYLKWTAEGAAVSGDMDSFFHLQPGTASAADAGAGNGVQGNHKSQIALSGPYKAAYLQGADYGAVVRVGPGGTAMPSMVIDGAAALSTTVIAGSVEYLAADGRFYLGVGTTLAREVVLTQKPFSVGSVTQPAGTTVTYRSGADWVELTIVVGGADVTTFNARVNFASALPAAPVVFGSFYSNDTGTTSPIFQYSGLTTRLQIALFASTLKAGVTYTVACMLRQP